MVFMSLAATAERSILLNEKQRGYASGSRLETTFP